MAIKKILYNLIIAAFLLSSCQKDLDLFIPDPGQPTGADSTWYNSITSTMPVITLKNRLLLNIQKDSFTLNSGTTSMVTTAAGLQCSFAGGALIDPAGQPVFGTVYIETHLLKKKGDIIRMGTPTTSNGHMLVSGGEFFVRLMKNGVELQLATNGHINVKYNDSPVSTLMGVFNGVENSQSGFNWLPNFDSINNRVTALNQSYEILSNRLQWINCDYFYDTSSASPRTTVSAVLPPYYTNANTVAYTVFNDLRSVIGMYGNANTKKFSTGNLPSNKQVTVVIISKQGDDYYLGHQQALTISPTAGNIGNQQVIVNPVKTSFENIQAYLSSL